MPGWLAPVAVSAGTAIVGTLFGKKKKQPKIPTFGEFYSDFRQRFPRAFGLSREEYAGILGSGARSITTERDTAIGRGLGQLPEGHAGRALVPLQAGAQGQEAFARLALQTGALGARTYRQDQAQFMSEAQGAYGGELQRAQLLMQQQAQDDAYYNAFLQSITDPIQAAMLERELSNLDQAQQMSYNPASGFNFSPSPSWMAGIGSVGA